MTTRYLAPLAVLALLSGCGLAETTTTAAAIAQRLQEAQQMAADQRKAAEASTE
jgi:outer membrane lipoprotein-sorting protein